MIYNEKVMDLFSVSDDYYFAQCISADFAMGKGIAVEFNNRFNVKVHLKQRYADYLYIYNYEQRIGDCILDGCVLNLITKERYYQKPTYNSITIALLTMSSICKSKGIKKVAMPLIGCGLDRLEWTRVSGIIQDIFKDMDIEILICKK